MINPVQRDSNSQSNEVQPVTRIYSNITTTALNGVSKHPSAKVHINKGITPLDRAIAATYSSAITKYQDAYFNCPEGERAELLKKRLEKTNGWDIKYVTLTSRNIVTQENELIGNLLFINDQLLDSDKIPPAPRVVRVETGNVTINERPLTEFLAPTNLEILAQKFGEIEVKEPFKK